MKTISILAIAFTATQIFAADAPAPNAPAKSVLKIKPGEINTYEDLADPKWKGQICTRSGSHVYMLSLLSSIIEHDGAAKAEAWATGVNANLARQPKGGDTDQIKAVAAGECSIALSNTYYIARLMKSDKADDRAMLSTAEREVRQIASEFRRHRQGGRKGERGRGAPRGRSDPRRRRRGR